MNMARKIPNEASKEIVDQAFDVLCGSKSFTLFSSQLPPDLKSVDVTAVNTRDGMIQGIGVSMDHTKSITIP